jgi:hypothetical protein
MNERLLLRLPHRQFVFTIPKVLRAFFRHDYFDIPQILINLKAEAFITGGLQ